MFMTTRRARLEALEDRRLMSFSPAVSYPMGPSPQDVVTADFNRDGKLDLATVNAGSNDVGVRLGDGAGGFGPVSRYATPATPLSLAVGDFDGDAKLDLATLSGRAEFAHVSVLRGQGDGTFQSAVNTMVWEEPLAMEAADFNADGRSDLVYSFADLMNWDNAVVAVLISDGRGGFTLSTDHINELNGSNPVGLAVGDLNADGKVDVVTADDGTGTVSVLLGNGDGSLNYDWSGPRTFAAGQSPRSVAVADFTGDGKPDLVVAGQGASTLRGRGDGTFDAAVALSVGGSPHTAVEAADFDGDGRRDAVVSDQSTGTVSVLLGNGDGTLRYANAFATGVSPSAVTVGDFDGDGRPDAAAANAGSGTVLVLLNDGNWSALPSPPPSLWISDATVTEGNSGTRSASFTVTLSAPSDQPVAVHYATANGTAAGGADYQASAGTLTFAPGMTTATIAIPVFGDRLAEPNETFSVRLIDPSNASVIDSEGVGTIFDDEPRLAINDASVIEGKGGTKVMTFTVTLSAAYDQVVSVNFATRNGTATAGEDYAARSGTLTFAPGETVKTFTVNINGDKKKEADEFFDVLLGNASGNAFIGIGSGRGTIVNDD